MSYHLLDTFLIQPLHTLVARMKSDSMHISLGNAFMGGHGRLFLSGRFKWCTDGEGLLHAFKFGFGIG